MREFRYQLRADAARFFVQCEAARGELAYSWTPAPVARVLATAAGIVAVGKDASRAAALTVQLLERAPADDFDTWSHIAECSLIVRSRRLLVTDSPEAAPEAARIEIDPGVYRVRVSRDAADYRVQVWMGEHTIPHILKP